MNVDSIMGALQQGLGRAGQGLQLPGDTDFASSLQLGQILKGRVLRHYEGSRYGVVFGGEERVVDSSIPLRNGELIHGRVVGLGETVHLQRVYPSGDAGAAPAERPAITGRGPLETALLQLLDRYQATMDGQSRAALLQMVQSAGRPELMSLAGLVVVKLGLGFSAELVRAVYRVLDLGRVPAPNADLDTAPSLGTATAAGSDRPDVVPQLAALLQGTLTDNQRVPGELVDLQSPLGHGAASGAPRGDTRSDGDSGSRQRHGRDLELGRLLLNVQSHGAVAHRVTRIPLWFGDRLVEVDVALFSQRERAGAGTGIRFRRIVLALETETLGPLQVTAQVAERNLRLEIATVRESSTRALAQYLAPLQEALALAGWQVDEVGYVTRLTDPQGEVVKSVVEHHITQDSLSRLM